MARVMYIISLEISTCFVFCETCVDVGIEKRGFLQLTSGIFVVCERAKVTSVGFEPTPTKTTALTLRLRPLGHDVVLST